MTDSNEPLKDPNAEGESSSTETTTTTTTVITDEYKEENTTETLFEQDQKEMPVNPQDFSADSIVAVRCRQCSTLVCRNAKLQAAVPAGNQVRFADVIVPDESETKGKVSVRAGIEYGIECTEVLCAACGSLLGVQTCSNRWTLHLLTTCLSKRVIQVKSSSTTTTTTTTNDAIGLALEQVKLSFDVGCLDNDDEEQQEQEQEQEQQPEQEVKEQQEIKQGEEQKVEEKETKKEENGGEGWGWMALGSFAALALPGVLAVLFHKK